MNNEYYPEAGENFYYFMERAKKTMNHKNQNYAHCIFNGIRIEVSNNSNVNDLQQIYQLKCELRRLRG